MEECEFYLLQFFGIEAVKVNIESYYIVKLEKASPCFSLGEAAVSLPQTPSPESVEKLSSFI